MNEAIAKLRDFFRSHKRAPSFDEIRELFNYKSKNAAYWLIKKLESVGKISRDSKGKIVWDSLMGIKVLGTVQAGFPSPAEEELVDVLSLDEYLIKNPQSTYMIKVSGDSMIDAGIHEGDLVLVERRRMPQIGDIVIAQVDGEWTMKYYEKQKNQVILRPANSHYPVIVPKRELTIEAVVISVIRKYK